MLNPYDHSLGLIGLKAAYQDWTYKAHFTYLKYICFVISFTPLFENSVHWNTACNPIKHISKTKEA